MTQKSVEILGFGGLQMSKLLIRISVKKNESFHSYIGRIAEANFISAKKLYIFLGLTYERTSYITYHLVNKEDVFKLSNLTGLPLAKIIKICNRFGDYTLEDGLNHPLSVIQRNKVKVCPACFRDDPYLRKYWNLAPITVCPIHHCLLVDKCSSCMNNISMNRMDFKQCNCGFEFVNLPELVISENESLFSNFFYSKLHKNNVKYKHIESPLLNLNIYELVELILGIINIFDLDREPYDRKKYLSSKTQNTSIHKLMNIFKNIFENWPENFRNYMRSINTEKERKSPKDNRINSILKSLNTPTYDFITNEITDIYRKPLIKRNRSQTNSSKNNILKLRSDPEWISVRETRKMLGGISVRTIYRLISRNKLDCTTEHIGKRKFTLIKRSSIESFIRSDFISMEDTMQLLNLSYSNSVMLFNHGLIEGEHNYNEIYYITKKSVTSCLSELERKAKLPKNNEVLIPLRKSLIFLVNSRNLTNIEFQITFADIVKQILLNRLTLYYTEGRGMEQFYLDKIELKEKFNLQ